MDSARTRGMLVCGSLAACSVRRALLYIGLGLETLCLRRGIEIRARAEGWKDVAQWGWKGEGGGYFET